MANNIIKPKGMLRANTPESGGASILSAPVLGIVKNNIDPIRQGRIWVYISELGSNDPDDSSGWVGVSYLSPFFGYVNGTAANNTDGTYVSNPSSYGFWSSQPDIGTTVLCIFVNGDPSFGYYIGCVPEADKLQMVPAIGAATNVVPNEGEAAALGGSIRLPVTNINSNNPAITNDPNFLEKPKPVHSYSAAIYTQQGLIRDPIRGPVSSSASRESPSRVGWGVSTPGRPIYEGGYNDTTIVTRGIKGVGSIPSLKVIARRSGHSIVMDDGDVAGRDQLVRIRTSLGHQILMSDDGQTLLIIHSNGQSYIEMGKEGTIDMFATNSVNIRTQGDLNLHADNNVNINAAKKFNIRAENVKIQSDKTTALKSGSDFTVDTLGTYTHKVTGAMSLSSTGDSSFASSGVTFINGSRINLNTGSTSTVPKSIPDIVLKSHTDTLFDRVKGFVAAPDLLKSIVSRSPAHMPWADAGKGIALKTTSSPQDILPAAPSTAVASVNRTVATSAVSQPVTVAGISTVPDTPPISKTLDKASTASLVGAVAQRAGTGITKNAVEAGYGIVKDGNNTFASIGKLAQNPKQLEIAGLIKPGSAALVNSLINAGKSIETAMATNLFTGKDGSTDLISVAKSVTTQVNAQVANFQRAQSALTSAGLISGKESAGSIGGLVLAGSSSGIANTLATVRNITQTISNLPANTQPGVSGVTSTVSQLINAGGYAATLSQRLSGGSSAVANALSFMNTVGQVSGSIAAQGVTGAAFNTILNQLVPLLPNRPQDLSAIAKRNAEARKLLYGFPEVDVIRAVGNVVGGSVGNVITSSANISGALGNIANATNSTEIIRATSSIVKNASQIASTYASGVDNLPGGQMVISSVRDLSSTIPVPGTSKIKSVIDNSLAAVTNGVSVQEAITSSFSSAGIQLSSNVGNVASNVASGVNSLVSIAHQNLSANQSALLNSFTNSADDGVSDSSAPSIGINTYDRSSLDENTTALIGNNLVPKPTFDSSSEESIAATGDVLEKRTQLVELTKQLEAAQDLLTAAREDWINEINAYVPSDARILAARQLVITRETEVRRIADLGIALERELGIIA